MSSVPLKPTGGWLLACVVLVIYHSRQGTQCLAAADLSWTEEAGLHEDADEFGQAMRLRLKEPANDFGPGNFRQNSLSPKENLRRVSLDQLLEVLSSSIPSARRGAGAGQARPQSQLAQRVQQERPIFRSGRTFPSSVYEPATGSLQLQQAISSVGPLGLVGLTWNPDGSQVKKQRVGAGPNVTPYYSSAGELTVNQTPRPLGAKSSAAGLSQQQQQHQQQQQQRLAHANNPHSQLDEDIQQMHDNFRFSDVASDLRGSIPPARPDRLVQRAQQTTRYRAGTEEVALHTPLHSQSSGDFEFKRVENSRGWNNLRGMWGKRSAISANTDHYQRRIKNLIRTTGGGGDDDEGGGQTGARGLQADGPQGSTNNQGGQQVEPM